MSVSERPKPNKNAVGQKKEQALGERTGLSF